MKERDNLLRILWETKEAVKKDDVITLKILSNQTLHAASIYQDTDNIIVAVIVYALSKILERKNYRQYKNWPEFFKMFMLCIDKAISALEKGQEAYFSHQLEHIRKNIDKLPGSFKRHIQEVFQKAKINKASRIYEHGISLEQTAKLLGITMWELAEYAGKTGISDVNLNITMQVRKRIKIAEEIFK